MDKLFSWFSRVDIQCANIKIRGLKKNQKNRKNARQLLQYLLDLRLISIIRKYVTVKLECSVPVFAKIKISGTAKSPNRENNVFYSNYLPKILIGTTIKW